MKRIVLVIGVVLLAATMMSCSKPLADARIQKEVRYESRDYAAVPNDVYGAVRWSLDENGYALDKEDLPGGRITSTWVPVTSDSHYIILFNRPSYLVNNSYYQLIVRVIPGEGRTKVKVGTRIKTLVSGLMSSGVEEKKMLASIGTYLRESDPTITNLGVTE